MIGTTDKGQAQIDLDEAKANQKVATMNSKAAVALAEATREELIGRVQALEFRMNTAIQKIQELEQKYNLLLSERFNSGPTA